MTTSPLTQLQPELTVYRPGPHGPEVWTAASVDTVIIDGRPEARWTYCRQTPFNDPWIVRRTATGELSALDGLAAGRAFSYQEDQYPVAAWPGAMYLRLATLLSITTGRLLAYEIAHLHFALEHLVSGPVMAGACSQIPSAAVAVRSHVLRRLPWLGFSDLQPPPFEENPEQLKVWLSEAERRLGYSHRIDPAPAGTWTPSDILTDIANTYDSGSASFRVTGL
jgi:hypothetical protein